MGINDLSRNVAVFSYNTEHMYKFRNDFAVFSSSLSREKMCTMFVLPELHIDHHFCPAEASITQAAFFFFFYTVSHL